LLALLVCPPHAFLTAACFAACFAAFAALLQAKREREEEEMVLQQIVAEKEESSLCVGAFVPAKSGGFAANPHSMTSVSGIAAVPPIPKGWKVEP
jgi:hypothetical protein